MTKRDFLVLVIKIFGLYVLVTTLFSVLPSNIAFALNDDIGPLLIFWVTAAVIIPVGLFLLLIFKAGNIVDFLRLGEGFSDERIDLGNLKQEDILKIAVFIIGGLLFIGYLPGLLSNIFWAFRGNIDGTEFSRIQKVELGVSALNVILGYLLFTNYDTVARRFKKDKADS